MKQTQNKGICHAGPDGPVVVHGRINVDRVNTKAAGADLDTGDVFNRPELTGDTSAEASVSEEPKQKLTQEEKERYHKLAQEYISTLSDDEVENLYDDIVAEVEGQFESDHESKRAWNDYIYNSAMKFYTGDLYCMSVFANVSRWPVGGGETVLEYDVEFDFGGSYFIGLDEQNSNPTASSLDEIIRDHEELAESDTRHFVGHSYLDLDESMDDDDIESEIVQMVEEEHRENLESRAIAMSDNLNTRERLYLATYPHKNYREGIFYDTDEDVTEYAMRKTINAYMRERIENR